MVSKGSEGKIRKDKVEKEEYKKKNKKKMRNDVKKKRKV
jgi:hypothetical protein